MHVEVYKVRVVAGPVHETPLKIRHVLHTLVITSAIVLVMSVISLARPPLINNQSRRASSVQMQKALR